MLNLWFRPIDLLPHMPMTALRLGHVRLIVRGIFSQVYQTAGLGSQSRVFLAPGSRSRLRKKNREPEPLRKKSGVGAAKKLSGSSALLEDKKHKEIVLL